MRRTSASTTSIETPFSSATTSPPTGTWPVRRKRQPADRVDIVILGQIAQADAIGGLQILQLGGNLGEDHAGAFLFPQKPGHLAVMFVLDLADHGFDRDPQRSPARQRPPCSSITSAICARSFCIFCKRTAAGMEGGAKL